MRTLSGHVGQVLSVAFSPDGTRVIRGSEDNLVNIWNAKTGAKVRVTRFRVVGCADFWASTLSLHSIAIWGSGL